MAWWDDPSYSEMWLPTSGSTINDMRLYSGLPSGGAGTSGSTLVSARDPFDWSKVAAGGAGLAASLFAPSGVDATKSIQGVQRNAQADLLTGRKIAGQGADALRPVLDYFKALVSGDPNAALAATQPERARVSDQYNAALRAAGQFTPRGGGQASTTQEIRAKEASDLASVTNTARANAANTLGTLGLSEQEQGLTMQRSAEQALASALGPLLQKEGMDTQNTIQTFAGIAAMIAPFLI